MINNLLSKTEASIRQIKKKNSPLHVMYVFKIKIISDT